MFQQSRPKKTYLSLISHEVKFHQNLIANQLENRKGKLLLLLSISERQIIAFYEDFWFHHIDLTEMKVLHQQKLQGRVYKGISINRNEIVVMLVQKKSIVHIDLQSQKVSQIFRITAGSYINPRKQTTIFFLSSLGAFNKSGTFYLKQNLTDDRKISFTYFHQLNKMSNHSQSKYVIRQFEAKNFIYSHFDEISTIVRFRQNPQQNGIFSYEQINLETEQIIEYKIEDQSFVLYSTVVEIRKLNQEKRLICLNSKNSSHEFMIFNKIEKTIQKIFTNTNILLKCILINEAENLGLFSFIYSNQKYKQSIMLINLQNGRIFDQIEQGINRVQISKDNNGFIQYTSQTRAREQLEFTIYRIVDKKTNYLKMMENLKLNLSYGQDFMILVANLLQ